MYKFADDQQLDEYSTYAGFVRELANVRTLARDASEGIPDWKEFRQVSLDACESFAVTAKIRVAPSEMFRYTGDKAVAQAISTPLPDGLDPPDWWQLGLRTDLHVLADSTTLTPDKETEDSDIRLGLYRKRIMLEMLYSRLTNTRTMGLFLALADGMNETDKPTTAELYREMDAMSRGKTRRAAKKGKGPANGPQDPASLIKIVTGDVEMRQAAPATGTGSGSASSAAVAEHGAGPSKWDSSGPWGLSDSDAWDKWDNKRATGSGSASSSAQGADPNDEWKNNTVGARRWNATTWAFQ